MEKIISLSYNWRTDALGNEHSELFSIGIDDVVHIDEETDHYGSRICYNVVHQNGKVIKVHNPNTVEYAIPERVSAPSIPQSFEDIPF